MINLIGTYFYILRILHITIKNLGFNGPSMNQNPLCTRILSIYSDSCVNENREYVIYARSEDISASYEIYFDRGYISHILYRLYISDKD